MLLVLVIGSKDAVIASPEPSRIPAIAPAAGNKFNEMPVPFPKIDATSAVVVVARSFVGRSLFANSGRSKIAILVN